MHRIRHRSASAVVVIAATALACNGGGTPGAMKGGASVAAAGAGAAAGLIPGTPPGGLADWVAEIREGTRAIPGQLASATTTAGQTAVDLYVGRHEYIELYYGRGGTLTKGSALGAAVEEAEARFHTLMRLLGETPPPDSARVSAAVTALSTQYDRVLEEARAANVPLAPPPGAAAGGAADRPRATPAAPS